MNTTRRSGADATAAPGGQGAAQAGEVLYGGGPGDLDLHLWNEGMNVRAYRALGAHPGTQVGVAGTSFAVWAPSAERVSVIGEFNDWSAERHPLRQIRQSGV